MTLLTLDKNLRLPYAQDWNLNVQRSFGSNWLFEIGYVGTKGTKLPRFIEGNPAVFVPGESTEDNVNQRRLYSGCTLADPAAPCNYASVGMIAGIANSTYNAMEVSLKKRFSYGLVVPCFLHVVEDARRCIYIQHHGIGFAERRGRKRPGAESI